MKFVWLLARGTKESHPTLFYTAQAIDSTAVWAIQCECMVYAAFKIFPGKAGIGQHHIGMGAVFLRDGNGTRVQIQIAAAKFLPGGHMSVAVQQNIPFGKRRRAGRVVMVAVGGKHCAGDRKSTRLNSSHTDSSRMPSSA